MKMFSVLAIDYVLTESPRQTHPQETISLKRQVLIIVR